MSHIIDNIRFYTFTYFTWFVFGLKILLDDIIGLLLGFLLAAQVVGDFNSLRRGYIASILIIIAMCRIEKIIRDKSKTFDLLNTITEPVNAGVPMNKVVYYRVRNHFAIIFTLLLTEIIKILCSVYCLIILAVEVGDGIFLNYLLLGILLVGSSLGIILDFLMITHILFMKNFYMKWLIWLSDWYLKETVVVNVEKTGNKLSMRFTEDF
jgi:hypothetical protein